MELLVRLPTPEPEFVRKALDVGLQNLSISHVGTPKEVHRTVRAARFRYDGDTGKRGLASLQASRWSLADDYVEIKDEEFHRQEAREEYLLHVIQSIANTAVLTLYYRTRVESRWQL